MYELAVGTERLAPLSAGERVLQHDVPDGEGPARKVQRVLRVITVLERDEQIEPPLERIEYCT